MAKYISLKFEPPTGTAFDYLINVEDILAVKEEAELFLASGVTLVFPLNVSGSDDYQGLLMLEYIRELYLDAKQRSGNEYIVAAEDGPFNITAFS